MDDGEGPSAEVNETSVEEVNAREDGGVVAPVGIQPGGVANEGETVGAIVDEMEREDSDNERVEEGDSSDDETDINPAEWASEDFSGLVVSEEDSVRWEYKENAVIQGTIYSRAEDMKEASRWCMRHMGANFFKQFKNKELMNMFKRLCNQNQEKKFSELWKRLDELTAKCSDQRAAAPSTADADPPQALGPLPTDSPTLVRRTGLEIRKFSQWILHEPKEKWPKAYDTGGARYGIMTTNLAEVYNWVMRGVRELPLVGIVEFILHGTCRGIYRKRVKQECVLKADGTCHCSCAKLKLLHRPCTHVIAAVAECGILDAVYVSQYFSKQAIYHTWSGEIYGFGIAWEFIETNDEVLNIPDPSKLRGKAGRRKTRRIRNDMNESEAGRDYQDQQQMELALRVKSLPPLDNVLGVVVPRLGAQLGTFRERTCGELLMVHDSFVERLCEAGLLPMCRLVEAAAGDADQARRWTVDRSLLAALVDRWRPETHTFHLSCGEDDLTAHFALVQRASHLPLEPLAHHRNTGPMKRWLLQFTVEQLQAEADEYSYSRCLEAYLLWLFGWVMFCGGHGHAVDKGLVHYARSIADAAVGEVPQWSWGSALLAALYRGLCEACTKTDPSVTFGGCPLFLSIWAAERIAIGRLEVDQHAYEESLYTERPEVDNPTMGTLWCRRQRRWAHVQVWWSYPEFVMEFDRLLPTDVVWEPYSAAATQARAPLGLSTLCTRDQAYWMTMVPMVFDICVEPHAPFRVMRQFGFRQPFPVPFPTTVLAAVHRYSRKGQQSAGDWPAKLATFVEDWLLATEEVVDHEGEPHTEEAYQAYLCWYQPRTRTRVTFAKSLEQQPHVASTRDLYARHRDQDFARAVDDINRVIVDGSTTIQRLGAGIPTTLLGQTQLYSGHPYRLVPVQLRTFLGRLPLRTEVPKKNNITSIINLLRRSRHVESGSTTGPCWDLLDRLLPSTLLFDITDFDFASGSTEDVIGPSQLGGVPPVQTQDQAQATPPPDTRATVLCHRIVSPTPRTTCEHRSGGPSVVAARGRARTTKEMSIQRMDRHQKGSNST
uniref:Mutator-like transposase n=1 Tax=Oryza sativa subsp. indica TaxID=39946 RepID=Q0P187_ORYSI|nr:mutator-like transposase [Oryza sativa Indica Group]